MVTRSGRQRWPGNRAIHAANPLCGPFATLHGIQHGLRFIKATFGFPPYEGTYEH